MMFHHIYSIYHISHLSRGFIGEPNGQLNSCENSFKFDNEPITRNFGGECGSFSICKFVVSSVTAEHQTYKTKTIMRNDIFIRDFKDKTPSIKLI